MLIKHKDPCSKHGWLRCHFLGVCRTSTWLIRPFHVNPKLVTILENLWEDVTKWRHIHGDGCLQTALFYEWPFNFNRFQNAISSPEVSPAPYRGWLSYFPYLFKRANNVNSIIALPRLDGAGVNQTLLTPLYPRSQGQVTRSMFWPQISDNSLLHCI